MNRLKELRKITRVELTILNWEHGTREIKGSNAKKLAEYFTKINEWAISHGLDKGNPKIEWMKVSKT